MESRIKPVWPSEQYGTASDGTPLHWFINQPKGSGPRPAVLAIHGGGFRKGDAVGPLNICSADLVAQGYIVFGPEYRLAPPGKLLGQKSDGRYPNQTDDLAIAVQKALADPRCDGRVQLLGGSAGGYFAVWFAAQGYGVGVSMSGATQLDDPSSLQAHGFSEDVNNYAPGHLAEASPNKFITSSSSPLYLAEYEQDSMPMGQFNTCIAKMGQAGVECVAKLLPGKGHAFNAWPLVKDEAIQFLVKHL